MAINFTTAFGKTPVQGGARTVNGQQVADRPKSDYWLNVGLPIEGEGVDEKFTFLSLPLGIPLDNVQPLALRGSNEEFLKFRAAQNDLFEQVMKQAGSLKPGESKLVNLAVQIRRVSEEPVAPRASENNFMQQLTV